MALYGLPSRPGPGAPIEEHLKAIAKGDEDAVGGLVRALAARELWQGADRLPGAGGDILILGARMPDGSSGAMVSTTADGVLAYSRAAVPFSLPGAEVLADLVDDPDCHGLVLNPAEQGHVALRKHAIVDGLAP